MRVITYKRLEEFWTVHPLAKSSLAQWYEAVSQANWRTFAEVRGVFNSADKVGRCVVFNVGGNKFRIIAAIHYQRQRDDKSWTLGRVYVREVLTRSDYDKGNWKEDCVSN